MNYNRQAVNVRQITFQANLRPITPRDVCPHCKKIVQVHQFFCGEHPIQTFSCRTHGAVVPMRSAVINDG